ncbi:sodium-dependent transporter [Alkalimarinus sediminis]|uniref:Sodium-dependent transporter n=1 Tax=Alkalimarinus sediminis TaxID=1632866 RepID=A0A9E8KIS4_9ALTE|nr:sodium-dependent transporter [Alkalimarinus sediminis]UZW74226.1 sodium-dependent transporter [Alkalimarinus sediminis]
MLGKHESIHGSWNSQLTFVLAATGAVVGLANLWKFPYLAGLHGGSFVIAYALCLLLVGVPIAMAEVALGRQGRKSPISSVNSLVVKAGSSRAWKSIGFLSVLSGFLILALYSVVGGMALAYVFSSAFGEFAGGGPAEVVDVLRRLQSSPSYFSSWHTLFLLLVVVVLARGVNRGLERAARILLPLMVVLIAILLLFSLQNGEMAKGFDYIFTMRKLTPQAWLDALGHAFFTLGIGAGAMMVYGAYMPGRAKIGRLMLIVALLDLVVAIAAGLVIFPILFAGNLEPIAGFGLLFHSMPLAYSPMDGGQIISVIFFVLITFAAWSSAIAVMEPAVAWCVEKFNVNRRFATLVVAVAAWGVGVAAILSFSNWQNFQIAGITIFNGLDIVTSRLLLPLGGLLIAIYVGWIVNKELIGVQFANYQPWFFSLWRLILRWFAPIAVVTIFIANLFELGEDLCKKESWAYCAAFKSGSEQPMLNDASLNAPPGEARASVTVQ